MNIKSETPPTAKAATVIGLGSMGTTLARLLLKAGYAVTVWNRTASKAAALAAEGARLAPSPAAAIAASQIVVVCVYDYRATEAIFNEPGVAAALAERTVIQLTTGSPRDAREGERFAQAHGADYLDGAIQAAPSQMARPDTTILVAGTERAFQRAEPVLRVFGGNIRNLGTTVSAAAAMDLATLSYVYGASLGFFHGARIAETEGLHVGTYGEIVQQIAPAFGDFLKHEGNVIQSGDFRITESPLSISVEATQRLLQTAKESGIDTEFPAYAAGVLQRAAAAGYANEEAAAIIKVLRASSPA